MTVDSWIFVQD